MTIPTYEQTNWTLDELFTSIDAPEIDESVEELEIILAEFEAFRPKLTADIAKSTFATILKKYEQIIELINRLYGYGSLNSSSDTQDQNAQAYLAKIAQIYTDSHNRWLFFTLWWQDLEDEKANELMESANGLSYWLEETRLHRPHILSEAEEKVISVKNVNGVRALSELYSTITNRYQFSLEEDGETIPRTQGELKTLYRSPNPDKREAAYKELYRVYGADAPILGQIYQFLVRDWRVERVNLRSYTSPLNVRNRYNDIPDEVVSTMMQVVRDNMPMFHRYFKLKAQWLGMETLRRYDLYAPVTIDDTTYSFNDAVQMVLNSLNEFDPRLYKMAKRVFDEQHYNSEIRSGKQGGAFCYPITPNLTPWILQSYQGKARDVATMAHEIGHAVHAMAAEHHSILVHHASTPLCETASTFTELLLIDKLMRENRSPELKRDLLFTSVDDAYATIVRQTYFAQFEIDAHEAINAGATIDELSDLYLANLEAQFGDSMETSDEFKYEWVSIPHIFRTPFYVYAYSFGQLLAFSLYRQYQQEGQGMIPRYVALLAAGGAESPIEILKKAGFDPYSADFWQGGFDIITTQIEQLEQLPVEQQ